MNYFQLHRDKIVTINNAKKSLDSHECLIVGNFETKEWHDEELDISDIPVELFFAVVNNTYSVALGLYIGLDMSFDAFKEKILNRIDQGKKQNFCGSSIIDYEHLNATGKIKSTREWNQKAAIKGHIWTCNSGAVGTIQSIVKRCREILQQQ